MKKILTTYASLKAKSMQGYHRSHYKVINKFEALVKYVGNNQDMHMATETNIDDTFSESQFLSEVFFKTK